MLWIISVSFCSFSQYFDIFSILSIFVLCLPFIYITQPDLSQFWSFKIRDTTLTITVWKSHVSWSLGSKIVKGPVGSVSCYELWEKKGQFCSCLDSNPLSLVSEARAWATKFTPDTTSSLFLASKVVDPKISCSSENVNGRVLNWEISGQGVHFLFLFLFV